MTHMLSPYLYVSTLRSCSSQPCLLCSSHPSPVVHLQTHYMCPAWSFFVSWVLGLECSSSRKVLTSLRSLLNLAFLVRPSLTILFKGFFVSLCILLPCFPLVTLHNTYVPQGIVFDGSGLLCRSFFHCCFSEPRTVPEM